MGSGVPLPKQVPNDGRVVGIPVNGNPSLATPTLQFNSVTNEFDWVAGGAASVNTVSIQVWGGTTASLGNLVIPFDPETDSILIPDNITLTSAAPQTLLLAKDLTDLQVPVGKKWIVVLLISRSSVDWTGKIRASDTVDTADGLILWDRTTTIITGERITSEIVTIAAQKFLTVETDAGTGILAGSIIIEKPA